MQNVYGYHFYGTQCACIRMLATTVTSTHCHLVISSKWCIYCAASNLCQCGAKINNPQVNEKSYKALVCPVLEYSQSIWDPHTSRVVKKIEASSIEQLATHLVDNACNACRVKLAAFSRKTQNWKTCYVLQNPLQFCRNQHASDIEIPQSSYKYWESIFLCHPSIQLWLSSSIFFSRTVKDWNILPQEVVQLGTVEALKMSCLPSTVNNHATHAAMGTPLFFLNSEREHRPYPEEIEDDIVTFF